MGLKGWKDTFTHKSPLTPLNHPLFPHLALAGPEFWLRTHLPMVKRTRRCPQGQGKLNLRPGHLLR